MSRKLVLILATAAACSAMPQIAAASCTGSACSSYVYASKQFTNKDKDLKIHLTGCAQARRGCGMISTSPSIPIRARLYEHGRVRGCRSTICGVRRSAAKGARQTLPSTSSVMTTIDNRTARQSR